MEIKTHLSEAELAELVSNESRGLGTHLEVCDDCLNEVARLRETAAALKTAADQPQEFWDRQRLAIRNRIVEAPVKLAPLSQRLAWVPVLALIILAGLLLTGGTPATPTIPQQAAIDPDHELLVAVEQVMQSNGPDALEPATYFVQQIAQQAHNNPRSAIRNQERHNAN
jgi:hypothetical protein